MTDRRFEEDLRALINSHSIENGSHTPDFILRDYILGCLQTYAATVRARDAWYGFAPWDRSPMPDPGTVS